MMPSQEPFNPYAGSWTSGTPPKNGNDAHTRDRLGRLERQVDRHADRLRRAEGRLDSIESSGARALATLPELVTRYVASHLLPLHLRVARLETSWWQPMRPHIWKVYMAVGFLIFARAYRAISGQPLDILTLIALLKG